jgi:ATP-dependent protease ClpP protease subunit
MTEKKELNFVEGNTIFIHDNFKSNISFCVLPYFDKLIKNEKNKKEGKIIIDIASDGGYVYYLKAMLARVEKAKKEGIIIETRVLSHAYSCGSMLACSGTKGYRFVSEDAEHLCHLGAAGLFVFNDTELEREAERVKAHFDFVRSKYKKYAKIPNLTQTIKDDKLYVRGQNIIDWELADKFY